MRALGDRLLRPIFRELPLESLDQRANGTSAPFYQDWLRHNNAGDAWWKPGNFDQNVPETRAPVSLVGGWQDIFLPWQLDDYRRLREAGREPFLLIGPWTHTDPQLLAHGIRDALAWQRAHLLGDSRQLRTSPVRVFVTGANEWRDYASWPPPARAVLTGTARTGRPAPQRLAARSLPLRSRRADAEPRRPTLGRKGRSRR
jgi:uncharacterized protein